MFSDLETLRADVKARLTPVLPSDWKTEANVEGTTKTLVPVFYIEFITIDSTFQGQPLGAGQVNAGFNLIITDPKTDTIKAENSVDAHLPKVIRALDGFSDLVWDKAEKKRLEDGTMAWAINAQALVSTMEGD